jgi:hypothetical protein
LVLVLVTQLRDERGFLDSLTPFLSNPAIMRGSLSEHVLALVFGDWKVTQSRRKEFASNARRQFDAALMSYCNSKESEAQTAGLVKVRERRNIDTYFWLAGYQVLHWPINSIASAEKRKRPTIGKQIRVLAAEIGLPMREEMDYDTSQTDGVIRGK